MMRIRKRNRVLRRIVLGFAVVALVVPGAAMAKVDEGLGVAKAQESYVPFVTDFPKYESTNVVSRAPEVRDFPTARTSNEVSQAPEVRDFPTARTSTEVSQAPEVRDFPGSVARVELGTYGLPHAGLNDYLRTHPGKALDKQNEVSTPQVVGSGGFDWGDAGIGAGILAGLIILIGGAGLAARELGRPQTA